MLRFIKVLGQSLAPDYREGDFVLVAKIPFLLNRLKKGDTVVFNHPVYGTMIKMVESSQAVRGEIFVLGTHQDSVDSRHFGPIRTADLIGKVIWHIRKPNLEPG